MELMKKHQKIAIIVGLLAVLSAPMAYAAPGAGNYDCVPSTQFTRLPNGDAPAGLNYCRGDKDIQRRLYDLEVKIEALEKKNIELQATIDFLQNNVMQALQSVMSFLAKLVK